VQEVVELGQVRSGQVGFRSRLAGEIQFGNGDVGGKSLTTASGCSGNEDNFPWIIRCDALGKGEEQVLTNVGGSLSSGTRKGQQSRPPIVYADLSVSNYLEAPC
jgi:hypothetical protein